MGIIENLKHNIMRVRNITMVLGAAITVEAVRLQALDPLDDLVDWMAEPYTDQAELTWEIIEGIQDWHDEEFGAFDEYLRSQADDLGAYFSSEFADHVG